MPPFNHKNKKMTQTIGKYKIPHVLVLLSYCGNVNQICFIIFVFREGGGRKAVKKKHNRCSFGASYCHNKSSCQAIFHYANN